MNATIIIPTFNALEYTRKCVNSLKLTTKFPYELIIVDNGSTDGTRKWIRQQKKITLITTNTNLGYAGACKIAIPITTSEYIILSNNDVVFTPGWLTQLVNTSELNPRIGLVGPITNMAAGLHKETLRPYINDEDLFKHAQEIKLRNQGFIHEVPWLVFFCTLIKRCVVDKIGPLDDSFGLGGHDDLDYSMRAEKAGFCCVIDRSVFVHHYCSRTYQANRMDYKTLLALARKKFCLKWHLKQSPL